MQVSWRINSWNMTENKFGAVRRTVKSTEAAEIKKSSSDRQRNLVRRDALFRRLGTEHMISADSRGEDS